MDKIHESLNEYQLSNVTDYDYSKIASILQGKIDITKSITIKKSYLHSLFNPILSYIIEYLNENGEKQGVLGKAKIDQIEVIYIILNHSIYDLFFRREKGFVLDGKNEINYNFKKEEENYFLPKKKCEEKEINIEALNRIALNFIGEEILNGEIEQLFELKKREIVSLFKFGYSIQEKIMNLLISNSKNKIKEIPNLIFYKTNQDHKIYSEVDRIITVDKLTEIDKFLIYAKAEFRKSKELKYTNIYNGEKLKLPENSCIFIEVKTTMKYLLQKQTNDDDLDYTSSASSVNSKGSAKINVSTKMYNNMITFLQLFDQLNIKFKKIILIIIVDSYFPKTFFEIAEKFVNSFEIKELKFNFDLYFIHIETNMTYVHDLTEIEKIKDDSKVKDEKIKNLKNDITNLKVDAKEKDAKIKNLEADSKEKEAKIKYLDQKFSELERQNKIRKMKKKIQKDEDLSNFIKKEINSKGEINVLKCEIKNKIKENEGLEIKDINNKTIFDSRTFCKLYYKKGNLDLINDIKRKHFKNLDKYSKNEEIKKLILIVDFVFLLSLKEIMQKYFKNKNVIITAATNNFFKVLFNEAKNSDEPKFILNEKIPGSKLLNLNEVKDMNNFIAYYFEIKENIDINNINKIKNYPLYNYLTNRNDFYLDIQEANSKNSIFDNAIFLVIDPVYAYEHLNLDLHKQSYKYIILLYKTYFFDVNQNIYDILSNYFFPNDDFDSISIPIEGENIENIIETNTKVLCRFKKIISYIY